MKGLLFIGWLLILNNFTWAARNVPQKYKHCIEGNSENVKRIKQFFTASPGKNMVYNRLAEFVDKSGPRFTGSASLEAAIDLMVSELNKEGFDRVYTENVSVPVWVRGNESAQMLHPRAANIQVLGLQNSISGSVEADVLVVKTLEELYQKRTEAVGKIVVFNQAWTDYSSGYLYRNKGASHASNVGAVAALIRSVTDFSLYTLHTGSQSFWPNITKIPSACITQEDAVMLQRMYDRGDRIRIRFQANHQNRPDGISRNVIAEITGSKYPDQVVMFGGHIDSWDVGVGAMDDGGGIMVTRQILSTVKALGLKPKRTMRLVMWTAEETGIYGGVQYYQKHKEDIDKISFVMESDMGTFAPRGLGLHNISGLAKAILEEIIERHHGDMSVFNGGGGTADISPWIKNGVPGGSLETRNEKYFYYHHTKADRMTVYSPDALDKSASLFSVVAYVLANMEEMLPRGGAYPTMPPAASGGGVTVSSVIVNCILMIFVIQCRI